MPWFRFSLNNKEGKNCCPAWKPSQFKNNVCSFSKCEIGLCFKEKSKIATGYLNGFTIYLDPLGKWLSIVYAKAYSQFAIDFDLHMFLRD